MFNFLCNVWVIHVGLDCFVRCIECKVDNKCLASDKRSLGQYIAGLCVRVAWADNNSEFEFWNISHMTFDLPIQKFDVFLFLTLLIIVMKIFDDWFRVVNRKLFRTDWQAYKRQYRIFCWRYIASCYQLVLELSKKIKHVIWYVI